MKTIVIDPGHGGTVKVGNSSPNNATGPTGLKEKDVTLDLAMRIGDQLSGTYRVLLTRNNDTNIGLADRAALASANNADVFLSIHFNGDDDAAIQGSETWVHSTSTSDSRLLAASVQQRLVGATGYADRRVKSKGLGVLSLHYQSPGTAACLAEVSFLTDSAEEGRLSDVSYKDRVTSGLVQAIVDYLNNASSVPASPIPSGDPTADADA